MRILFMGTPDFAVPSLDALSSRFNVVGVITQPDKPQGRHMTLTPSPVKVFALNKAIDVYQPETLKDGAIKGLLEELQPDIIAVVAYGKILPEYILDFPKYGCINLHGSLLPSYRGAAPMQRAIIDGNKICGVTTMFMAKGLDTGDMLEKAEIEIHENDNFEIIHDKLSLLGAELLVSTIGKLRDNAISPIKQDDSLASYAKKIENEDCKIDFSKSAQTIHNLIRGLSPIPLAYCIHNGKKLKIISSEIVCHDGENSEYGVVTSTDSGRITVKCGIGELAIFGVLPEGKGKMKAADYINGRKIFVGDKLLT